MGSENHGGQTKLSLVTISYNACSTIQKTIDSVALQNNKAFEYIVVDGASSDGTLEIIQSNNHIINYVLSEPDDGIADAMNKALRMINGEYVVFLHADDYFADTSCIDRIYSAIHSGEDIIAFDIGIESESGIKRLKSRGFSFYTHLKTPFYHPGTVCKADMLRQLGGFDSRFKIAMDYDLFLRAYKCGATQKREDFLLTVFGDDGISSRKDVGSLRKRLDEEEWVQCKNDRSLFWRLVRCVWWTLYRPYKLYLTR